MHELAICQSLVEQVEHIAHEHNNSRVVLIVVGMGALSGVEAQLLRHAYPVASAGTVAEHAQLVLHPGTHADDAAQCFDVPASDDGR